MKSATIPSLRVDPELRRAAEGVLEEGETLSGFVEKSIRAQIDFRQGQKEFIARGLRARDEARSSGTYYSAEQVQAEIDELLSEAERVKESGR